MKNKRKIIISVVLLIALILAYKGYKKSRVGVDDPCVPTDQERLNKDQCGCQGIAESSSATGRISKLTRDGFLLDGYCRTPLGSEVACRCANPDL